MSRYFSEQQATLYEVIAAVDEAGRTIEEYTEEHAVEDGLLAEAMDDGKVTKALASERLRDARREGSDPDEVKALQHIIKLYEAESAAKKAAKDVQAALDLATLRKYGEIDEAEIRQLVLDAKWRDSVSSRVASELVDLTLSLVGRIEELGERYGETLEDLEAEAAKVKSRVAAYLADMGVR